MQAGDKLVVLEIDSNSVCDFAIDFPANDQDSQVGWIEPDP
jgi:hypothetical protein